MHMMKRNMSSGAYNVLVVVLVAVIDVKANGLAIGDVNRHSGSKRQVARSQPARMLDLKTAGHQFQFRTLENDEDLKHTVRSFSKPDYLSSKNMEKKIRTSGMDKDDVETMDHTVHSDKVTMHQNQPNQANLSQGKGYDGVDTAGDQKGENGPIFVESRLEYEDVPESRMAEKESLKHLVTATQQVMQTNLNKWLKSKQELFSMLDHPNHDFGHVQEELQANQPSEIGMFNASSFSHFALQLHFGEAEWLQHALPSEEDMNDNSDMENWYNTTQFERKYLNLLYLNISRSVPMMNVMGVVGPSNNSSEGSGTRPEGLSSRLQRELSQLQRITCCGELAGRVRHKRSANVDTNARHKEAMIAESWCHPCPPGFEVQHNCTTEDPTLCMACPENHFSNNLGHSHCVPCHKCPPGHDPVWICSPTHDQLCMESSRAVKYHQYMRSRQMAPGGLHNSKSFTSGNLSLFNQTFTADYPNYDNSNQYIPMAGVQAGSGNSDKDFTDKFYASGNRESDIAHIQNDASISFTTTTNIFVIVACASTLIFFVLVTAILVFARQQLTPIQQLRSHGTRRQNSCHGPGESMHMMEANDRRSPEEPSDILDNISVPGSARQSKVINADRVQHGAEEPLLNYSVEIHPRNKHPAHGANIIESNHVPLSNRTSPDPDMARLVEDTFGLSKTVKDDNVNRYVRQDSSSGIPCSEVAWSLDGSEQGWTQMLVSSVGALLQPKGSDVMLEVGYGAVPEDRVYAIGGRSLVNLEPFANLVDWENNEEFVSAVPEFKVQESFYFEKHVKIRIPHCVSDPNLLPDIKVHYGDLDVGFQRAPNQAKENNIYQDVYFLVDAKYVYVYTTHFTKFVCICKKSHDVQLEAILFGRDRCYNNSQEVEMNVYLCNSLYLLGDFKEKLKCRENCDPLRSWSIELPAGGLSKKDEVTVTLEIEDKDNWKPRKMANRGVLFELTKTKTVSELGMCPNSSHPPPLSATFVIVTESLENPKTHFTAVLDVQVVAHARKKILKKDRPHKVSKTTQLIVYDISDKSNKLPSSSSVSGGRHTGGPGSILSFLPQAEDTQVPGIPNFVSSVEKACEHVAQHLPREAFPSLSRALGITQSVLEEVQERWPRDLREQKYQMLLHWLQQRGRDASVEGLVNSLASDSVGQCSLAQQLRDQFCFGFTSNGSQNEISGAELGDKLSGSSRPTRNHVSNNYNNIDEIDVFDDQSLPSFEAEPHPVNHPTSQHPGHHLLTDEPDAESMISASFDCSVEVPDADSGHEEEQDESSTSDNETELKQICNNLNQISSNPP